jgi:hypothetical protein
MDVLKLGRAMVRHVARQAYDAHVVQHGHADAVWQARRVGTEFILDVDDRGAQEYLNQQLEALLAELHP